ncbi:MAG: hypothetical protein M1541_04305 [Acidobacteria bacterium]|nr:hypothetical protein [Acidobacteriota bacterium]
MQHTNKVAVLAALLAAAVCVAAQLTQQVTQTPPTVAITITMPKTVYDAVWARVRMERVSGIAADGKPTSAPRYASLEAFIKSLIAERCTMYAPEADSTIQQLESDIKAKQEELRQRRQALVTVTAQ